MGRIIGIDLGTTNSVCAIMDGGEPSIIPNTEGGRLTPSVIAVDPKSKERLVGQLAKRQAIVNPKNTAFSIKRFMGRKWNDPEVQRALAVVPYQVEAADNGDVRIVLDGKAYSPPELAAMILQKIKMDAETYLSEPVTQAVITVPAYFNDAQRQATKDAGRIAGLEVLRIINEPTASSLAYGLDKTNVGVIAVFDLGGGTFDISILDVGDGVFEVRSTNGDTFLGGDDWDHAIMEWILAEFEQEAGINLRHELQAVQRIREAAERAKIELSTLIETPISLPFICADASGPRHLELRLTRAQLEHLTHELIERTIAPCRRALRDARLEPGDIDGIVLVGGMTRMPAIRQKVAEYFGKEPQRGANPDEIVGLGAAVQAGVLGGDVKDVLLLDVIPLSLSLETLGGVASQLIARNTTIPTLKTQVFSTATDNQGQVEIHVVQGERTLAADNKSLGRFILDGIPAAPKGIPQIEVTFDINADGILKVTAVDKSTGRAQSMQVVPTTGLDEGEIDQMIAEARAHERADAERRSLIEARNQADHALYMAATFLREAVSQLSERARRRIALLAEDVRRFKIEENRQAISQASEELIRAIREEGEPIFGNGRAAKSSATNTKSG